MNKIKKVFSSLIRNEGPVSSAKASSTGLLKVEQDFYIKVPALPCWCCGNNEIFSIPPTYRDTLTCICNKCGLVQRRKINSDGREESTKGFYFGADHNAAYRVMEDRMLHTETRLRVFLDFVEKYVDLKNVKSSVDIGGAEGFFSRLLLDKHPGIKAFNVDPDTGCTEYGKKHFPKVNFVIGTSEVPNITGQFDLITDIGGVYRAVDPYKALGNYYELLSDSGKLVVAINELGNLHNARTGKHPDSIALFDPPHSDVFQRTLFDIELFRHFLSTHFNVLAEEKIIPLPFYQKEISFFVCSKKQRDGVSRRINFNSFENNYNYLKSYARNLSVFRLKKLKKELGLQKVCILGSGPEAVILKEICAALEIGVPGMISPHLPESDGNTIHGLPVFDWRAFFQLEFDTCLIADTQKQEKYIEFIKFCQMEKKKKVYAGFDKRDNRIPVTLFWDNETILFHAFSFAEI